MQNVNLLDLFFCSTTQHQHENDETKWVKVVGGSGTSSSNIFDKTKSYCSIFFSSLCSFIIFSLLLPYVHSEGSLGHQARDALLLCMSLSQKNSNVGTYIAKYSSMCPVLVTGLGGLYSSLPNSFDIGQSDWYRITPDDVADIPKLTLFMNCLEFCNAVVQVAHQLIKQQLLDFMYQGFIVPILGPALLQVEISTTTTTTNPKKYWNCKLHIVHKYTTQRILTQYRGLDNSFPYFLWFEPSFIEPHISRTYFIKKNTSTHPPIHTLKWHFYRCCSCLDFWIESIFLGEKLTFGK